MGKVSHSPGIIIQQAGVGGQVKSSAVHLGTAGIQCAEHGALAGVGSGQRFQCGDRGAEGLAGESQPLDGGQPDAQAGKAAGACVHTEQVDVCTGQAAQLQAVIHQRHQGLAVGHAAVQIALVLQAVVLQQGHAQCFTGGVYG